MDGKILVVDDEMDVCRVLVEFFQLREYSADYALNGPDALEKIKKENPDVVLLDIHLPDMDGIEILQKIREYSEKIGVIMVTGVSDREIGMKALELGASDFVKKPIDLNVLETSVIAKILSSMS